MFSQISEAIFNNKCKKLASITIHMLDNRKVFSLLFFYLLIRKRLSLWNSSLFLDAIDEMEPRQMEVNWNSTYITFREEIEKRYLIYFHFNNHVSKFRQLAILRILRILKFNLMKRYYLCVIKAHLLFYCEQLKNF